MLFHEKRLKQKESYNFCRAIFKYMREVYNNNQILDLIYYLNMYCIRIWIRVIISVGFRWKIERSGRIRRYNWSRNSHVTRQYTHFKSSGENVFRSFCVLFLIKSSGETKCERKTQMIYLKCHLWFVVVLRWWKFRWMEKRWYSNSRNRRLN